MTDISLSAIAKEVHETELPQNWGRVLVERILAVENQVHRETLLIAMARPYMASYNSRIRKNFDTEDLEEFVDPHEPVVRAPVRRGAEITESQTLSTNIRIVRRLQRWNDMLNETYFSPTYGCIKKLADLTKNEMREASEYQKKMIRDSIAKNAGFDKFIESIPELYADVTARNLPEEKALEAVDNYMAA